MYRLSSKLIILGLAAAFWVMPSVGTQGMGTIGQRFVHPDRRLVDVPVETDPVPVAALRNADRAVEAALGF